MSNPRLEVTDLQGRRTVSIEKAEFAVGRRPTNDLTLSGGEVSRDHAVIISEGDRFLLRDLGSNFGTFVNGVQITERVLVHGDRIQLGESGGTEMVFMLPESSPPAPADRSTTSAIGELRDITALLEGLRALGSARVLDDVLAVVMDSAIAVSGAERGFIMLASDAAELEFKLGRARDRTTLPGAQFEISRKIPEEVFETGEARIVADLFDQDQASVHMATVEFGIRHVLCVPLDLVRYAETAELAVEERRIGVLYLDSREKGSLLSDATRAALETLATEAAVAIENARLYRETLEKARLDQEMRIAGEIQQALLPQASHAGGYFEAAAIMQPCRAIGGDFFDYVDLPAGEFGFTLGDVAGKGPPAALMSAMLQGFFAALATNSPASTIASINQKFLRRAIQARFVTMFYGVVSREGRLTYCNAGHNPPFLFSQDGVRRLETGGIVVGMFEGVQFEEEPLSLKPGDTLLVFSDGLSEASDADGEQFGDPRILECVTANLNSDLPTLLAALFACVREFAAGAPQSDDATVLVVRYRGPDGLPGA